MEPYGILGWAVLDREEEIFESDDIPDEHKVMHALWGRWIFFNRQVLFVEVHQFVSILLLLETCLFHIISMGPNHSLTNTGR
jgi:hypothetical protein